MLPVQGRVSSNQAWTAQTLEPFQTADYSKYPDKRGGWLMFIRLENVRDLSILLH